MKKYLGIRQARRDAWQKKDHPMPYFEIIFWQGNASFLNQRGLPLILLKLTAALGITWVLGFALAFYPSPYLEYPFVIINSCQGKSFLSVLHFPTPLFCNKSFGLAKRHAKCVVVYFCKRLAIDRTIVTFCQLCKTTENLLTIFKIERHSNNGKRKSYPYNCSRLVRLVAVEHTQRNLSITKADSDLAKGENGKGRIVRLTTMPWSRLENIDRIMNDSLEKCGGFLLLWHFFHDGHKLE